ncbi:hypothetical protein ACLI4U_18990 (plasmid) [Natrialbaceae archaeon A-CW2]
MTTETTTRRQYMRRSGAALTTVGVAGLAQSASAETNSRQGILADGVGEGGDLFAFVRGFASKYRDSFGPPDQLETLSDRARNEFNANSQAWVDYGNWLITEQDVEPLGGATVAVDWELTRGRWPTGHGDLETHIDVGFDDDNDRFTSIEWHDESVDEPDYYVTLRNHAAESAADELSEFRREYIEDEKSVPDVEYVSRLAGRYADGIALGEDSSNVVGLFIGGDDHGF